MSPSGFSRSLRLAVGALLLCLPQAAHAQRLLYDTAPPPDAALLRFVNGTDKALTVQSSGPDAAALPDRLAGFETSSYVVLKPGADYRFTFGNGAIVYDYRGKASEKLTVVLTGLSEPAFYEVDDSSLRMTSEAQLNFYNAAPTCSSAGLRLGGTTTDVFADVAPGTARQRLGNPVEAPVDAVCDGKQPASVGLKGLKAGQSFSLFLLGTGGRTLTLVPDSIRTHG